MRTVTVAAPVRMSDEQMKALKYLISMSQNMNVFSKKLLFWLLDQTDNLTRPVRINVVPSKCNPSLNDIEVRAAHHSFHDIMSSNGSTHFHAVIVAMGATLYISSHGGFFGRSRNDKESGPSKTFAVWIAPKHYDWDATLLDVDWDAVFKTDLESGLYS